jgi:hypothetical protein
MHAQHGRQYDLNFTWLVPIVNVPWETEGAAKQGGTVYLRFSDGDQPVAPPLS